MSKFITNRRELMKMLGGVTAGAGLLLSPAGMLLEAMTRGVYGRAMAQAGGIRPRKWIDMRFDHAPPRWVYDLFLTPYAGGAPFVANDHLGTRYVATGRRYTDVEYKTVSMKGINVPWLWQYNVPAANGPDRSMAPLLDNMLQMRGVMVGNPDHLGACKLHYRPLGALQTLSALSADSSTAPIAALYYQAFGFEFGSTANKSPVRLEGRNLIESLLSPFISQSSSAFKTARGDLKTYLAAARDVFAGDLTGKNPGHGIAVEAQNSSVLLFETTFGDLTVVWNQLFNKYADLINRAFDPTKIMIGINDLPIGITPPRSKHYQYASVLVTNADLRTIIGANTTMTAHMAQSFAIAEFVMSRNLSDSLTLSMGKIDNLNISGTSTQSDPDEHFTGKMPSLLVNTYMARAHAACLLELIDQLKSPAINCFDETVINFSGEFNRRPRVDGFGSDHNYEGGNYTLLSGCIDGPKVIGNIKANSGEAVYSGTYGYGAPIATLGGQQLDLGYCSASIATMLRTPSPVSARSSVLREERGKIVPIIANAKNV